MHIRLHQFTECFIYQTVTLNRRQSSKPRRNNGDREMPSAAAGTGVTGMFRRVVGDFDMASIKSFTQAALDECGAVAHGSILRNGFTVTLA